MTKRMPAEPERLRAAERRGRAAWEAGQTRGSNPYIKREDDPEWRAWDTAWVKARDESMGDE